jgi:hypothetical protein
MNRPKEIREIARDESEKSCDPESQDSRQVSKCDGEDVTVMPAKAWGRIPRELANQDERRIPQASRLATWSEYW